MILPGGGGPAHGPSSPGEKGFEKIIDFAMQLVGGAETSPGTRRGAQGTTSQ